MTMLGAVLLIAFLFETGKAAENCGQLVAQTKDIPLLSEARLDFYGYSNNDFYALQLKVDGGGYQVVPPRDYEEAQSTRTSGLSVLKIHRSQFSHSGTYRVHCRNGLYSTEAKLVIKAFPPSPPEFGNIQTFPSCTNCISGWVGKLMFVTCSTWNGTEPVSMEIRKNNVLLPGLSTSSPAVGEKKGLVSFTPVSADHEAELLCRVNNQVSTQPLIATTRIYIKKLPDNPIIGTTVSEEGITTNITCTSNGGRPAPSMHFLYNNTHYAVAKTAFPLKDAFFIESVLSKTFTRYDNRKNIKCCSKVSEDAVDQCTSQRLRVLFPPQSAKLEKLHDISKGTELTNQVIQCTVGESLPSSDIEWGGLDDIDHNLAESYSLQGKYGSVRKVQTVGMQLSPSDNGRVITCTASNKKFPSARPAASFTLNVTYAPIVSLTPDKNVTANFGDDVSIICSVDGNPPASIAWYYGADIILEIHEGRALSDSLVLDLYNVSFTSPTTFTCVADNNIGKPRQQNITIIVTDKKFDRLEGSDDQGSSSGAIAAVLCVLALLAVVGVIVGVALRRRRKHEVKLRSDVLQIRIEERQASINPQVDEPMYNNINNMNTHDDTEEKDDDEQIPLNANPEAPKELVYAELELNNPAIKPRPVVKSSSETEYVSIDFTKKESSSPEGLE